MRFRWLKAEAGRKKGEVEEMDRDSPVTQVWQKFGWIEPLEFPKPEPEPEPEIVEDTKPTGRYKTRRMKAED
jgi:hypothetical protein